MEFATEDDAEYAVRVMNGVRMLGKPLKVNKAQQDKKMEEIGANLFIGNLDTEVDEKILSDTFASFGRMVGAPKVMRDGDTGLSKVIHLNSSRFILSTFDLPRASGLSPTTHLRQLTWLLSV